MRFFVLYFGFVSSLISLGCLLVGWLYLGIKCKWMMSVHVCVVGV